ncbi:TRAFAC clade GTPase domain-containing protein [Streptomyces tricolor]|uniref:TRAFAC clade GTPase domain-containing protein n=1 Tax=Streptomyces tricolor TaxID=68277 RepID=UPI0036EA507D
MTTVTCPYCFTRASAARLPYRCLMNPTGVRGAAPCGPEPDEKWAAFVGPGVPPAARMRGPVFTPARRFAGLAGPAGTGSSVPCPACGVPTHVRVCGSCHSDLPSDYCDQDGRIIALVGAKASGKSTFVAVLRNEFDHRVGHAYNATLAAMGPQSQARDKEMAEDLYERLRLPAATRPAALGFNDPLLYRLSLPKRGPLGRSGTRHTALVFYDAAGEDLADAEAMDRYTRYLSAADGIILLVDPLQLGSVRDRLPVHEGPPLPVVETSPRQIAADLATQLRAHGKGKPGGRVTTPIAVAVTKTDMLRSLLDPHSPLLRNAAHSGGAYDAEDRLAVHEELRTLLTDWDAGALLRQLEHDFDRLSLFGLSALGAPPPADAPADVPKSGPQPVRVEDPLLWLLSLRGLLPVRTAAQDRTGKERAR